MKFPTPCTYTAPNVFGGYCPAKREAPAYTMHGRKFAPLPQTGTVTEYLACCTTSSLHQTKEVLFPIRGSVIETVSYAVNCWISHALVCVRSSHHLALGTRLPTILFLLVVCKIKRKNFVNCKQSQTKPILLVCALKSEVVPITLCVDIRFCEGAWAQLVRHCRSQECDTETLPSFHHCQQEGRNKTKSVSCSYTTCTKSVCHVWAIPSFSTVAMWSWAIVNCFSLWYCERLIHSQASI